MPFSFKHKGVYRIFDCVGYQDFAQPDVEFESVLGRALAQAVSNKPLEDIRIAVVDSGIYVNSGNPNDYFLPRWIAGRDFTKFKQGHDTGGKPQTMGKHGSCVASIAGFGSTRLKLIDVMVERSQEGGGAFNAEHFVSGIEWALSKGARIVNSSKQADWSHPKVGALVAKHPNVLFIDTAGNNKREFTAQYKEDAKLAYGGGNTILVGGAHNDGTPSNERGYGPAVDVMLPSFGVPCLAPRPVRMAYYQSFFLAKYNQQEEELRRKFDEETRTLGQKIQELEQQIKNPTEDTNVTMLQLKLNQLKKPRVYRPGRAPIEPEQSDVTSDDGTSFACPMVANIAAKILIINPLLSIPKVIAILVRTSDKIPALKGKCRSGGFVNPARAYVHALLEGGASRPEINDLFKAMQNSPLLEQARARGESWKGDSGDGWD